MPIGLITAIGAVPVALWFKPGYLISGVDFTVPFHPVQYFLTVWSGWSNPVGSTVNSLPVASPYLAMLALFRAVGLPTDVGEIATFAVIFLLPGWTMWALLGRWTDSSAARFAGSLLYMLNPFTMIIWQTGAAINQIAYGLAPLVVLLVDRALTEPRLSRWHWAQVALTSLLLAASASNPPTVIGAVVVPVVIVTLSHWRRGVVPFSQKTRRLVATGGVAVGVNLWWLAPALAAIANGSLNSGFSNAVETQNPPDLSASVPFFDQLTGFGYWGWRESYLGVPYFSIARDYSPWWAKALICVPVLVAVGGCWQWFRRDGHAYHRVIAVGVALWLVGFIFSFGFHGPYGALYKWAYFHVPGFDVFRSPWEKFSVAQVMGIALLCAIAVDAWFLHRLRRSPANERPRGGRATSGRTRQLVVMGLVAALAAGVVFPMFGSMFNNRDDGHRAYYTSLPGYVSRFADFVNSRPRCALFMPEWAWTVYVAYPWYHGGGANLNALFQCTLLEGDSAPTTPQQQVAVRLDDAIAANVPRTQLAQTLGSLGITDVVVPLDEDYAFYKTGPTPEQLASYFESGTTFRRLAFGPWLDFTLPRSDIVGGVYASAGSVQTYNSSSQVRLGGTGLLAGLRSDGAAPGRGSVTVIRQEDGSYLLRDLNGSALVTMLNVYDPGWHLQISPTGQGSTVPRIRHVVTDSYANGWIIDGHGAYVVRFTYEAKTWIILGAAASLLCLCLVGLKLMMDYRRRDNRWP